ncbi:energy transducer TonB [Pseudomonas syringae group genomosp. 3]|uniref:Protein TonB n=1 Tax=Pseudomonas syringae pv. primulae TaxID=251707 RepID=A0A3M3YEA7_9PSED|nr:energy transducer TonB [Pseudomonas syringae group genomosp. 3]RMO80409.1 TonB protein [Pseudomonas syringae pv. primulae]RMU38303.1 TonB protein [Pseudomonas syringae pv. primulae]
MTTMTLMLEDAPPTREWLNGPLLRSNGLAAAIALALHGALLGGLMLGWNAQEKRPEPPGTLTTQLVMLPPAPPPVSAAPVAVAEAVQTPPPAPVVAPPPVVKPLEAPKPQAQPQRQLEQAALARKRVDEQKRERETEQRQRAQNAREAEQQRQQVQAEQQRQAEQARQSAERARQTQVQQQQQAQQQAAADSSQYQPLSKEAPDYPERALDKGIEGDCTVVYDVSPQGKVVNPQVQGSCHPLFMRPSLAAAETFRYQPRIVEGRAVMVSGVKNTFHYRIK